ncbi:T9SS type A sorting domain-containing protein [Sphingobacterium oryzagri]|uniref:T9SS type A sorting domain-containing protein n=1 Tax=Sphingobacterium oryzagri TaxID=3025669 RepID=A0ABY7WEC7_9SPHI|nr:T9SS type A sorting domain-containing protein [Sphingobacterium sp. KACC 22765]WDF67996.1 T9SS type A sorting domain-containing protein [Sphingobacterium sp. KACC 22765]
MKKIAFVALASVCMLQAGRAMHSNSGNISFATVVAPHLPEEEAEKLINNVKVFYNPVAEQITANFKLSKQGTVAIKVMDALGNEVLNLMNGRLDAGVQNLSFDANGKLTAGFYFVRVSSGAETVVKRVSVR